MSIASLVVSAYQSEDKQIWIVLGAPAALYCRQLRVNLAMANIPFRVVLPGSLRCPIWKLTAAIYCHLVAFDHRG